MTDFLILLLTDTITHNQPPLYAIQSTNSSVTRPHVQEKTGTSVDVYQVSKYRVLMVETVSFLCN